MKPSLIRAEVKLLNHIAIQVSYDVTLAVSWQYSNLAGRWTIPCKGCFGHVKLFFGVTKKCDVLIMLFVRNIQSRLRGFYGRICSAQTQTRMGCLRKSPEVEFDSYRWLSHLGVRAPYAARRKRRYKANQVWMNTTFILQGPQSWGKLGVETWRVKTE